MLSTAVVVSAADQPCGIDEYIGGLDHLGAARRSMGRGRGRAHSARPPWVGIDREYRIRALRHSDRWQRSSRSSRTRSVHEHCAGRSVCPPLAHNRLRSGGKGGDAHRIMFDAVIEHPDELEPVFLMIKDCLIEHDEQIAIRQGQAVVGASAEARRPVACAISLGRLRSGRRRTRACLRRASGGVGDVAVHNGSACKP